MLTDLVKKIREK